MARGVQAAAGVRGGVKLELQKGAPYRRIAKAYQVSLGFVALCQKELSRPALTSLLLFAVGGCREGPQNRYFPIYSLSGVEICLLGRQNFLFLEPRPHLQPDLSAKSTSHPQGPVTAKPGGARPLP